MMYSRLGLALLCLFFCPMFISAQPQTNPTPLDAISYDPSSAPPPVLQFSPVRDGDVMWEKRVWRVIDTREKINLPFRYPSTPLITLLLDGIANGKITAYGTEDDRFSSSMSQQEIDESVNTLDTVWITDPVTGEVRFQPIVNSLDPESIVRYRIQEVWYFNKRTSQMEVRILGIAPLIEEFNADGSFRYERPLFWVHYPSSRSFLASQSSFVVGNDRGRMSWTDRLDMRFFDSHIYKVSNVHDQRLSDYLSGTDLLWAAELQEREIQNRELDLWSW